MLTLINLADQQPEAFASSMNDEIALERRLDELRNRHRDLDLTIDANSEQLRNQLEIQRLKRERLSLRDKIREIEAILYPDIIA